MSSFRNASKSCQRTHKERSQPSAREKLGLLEKKKDYKLRAKDFQSKKRTLNKLRKKAQDKNPDEFYFHMINSGMDEDGVHRELKKQKKETSMDQIKLMQSQDYRYVAHKLSVEAKKIEKLKSSLHLLDVEGKPKNKHTFFVDTRKEVGAFQVAKRLDTPEELLDRKYNRPRLSWLKNLSLDVNEEIMNEIESEKEKSYQQLAKRIDREKTLFVIGQKLQVKQHLANKKESAPKRIQKETIYTPPLYKWKQERKR